MFAKLNNFKKKEKKSSNLSIDIDDVKFDACDLKFKNKKGSCGIPETLACCTCGTCGLGAILTTTVGACTACTAATGLTAALGTIGAGIAACEVCTCTAATAVAGVIGTCCAGVTALASVAATGLVGCATCTCCGTAGIAEVVGCAGCGTLGLASCLGCAGVTSAAGCCGNFFICFFIRLSELFIYFIFFRFGWSNIISSMLSMFVSIIRIFLSYNLYVFCVLVLKIKLNFLVSCLFVQELFFYLILYAKLLKHTNYISVLLL
jgi:hypothetical protein